MHAPCFFQTGKANESISSLKRKCTLEFRAYSWDYCAKQWCGLAIVHLIYNAAPHLPSASLTQQLFLDIGCLGPNLKVQTSEFPSSCR